MNLKKNLTRLVLVSCIFPLLVFGDNLNIKIDRAKKIERLYSGISCDNLLYRYPEINNKVIQVYLFDNSCYIPKKYRNKSFCYFIDNGIRVMAEYNNVKIFKDNKEIKEKEVISNAEKLTDDILRDLLKR